MSRWGFLKGGPLVLMDTLAVVVGMSLVVVAVVGEVVVLVGFGGGERWWSR